MTWRVLIKAGMRKRLVVAISFEPIAGSTIIRSRLLGKMFLNSAPCNVCVAGESACNMTNDHVLRIRDEALSIETIRIFSPI